MQSHKLLLNEFFSTSGQTVNSDLELGNNYYSHFIQLNGGGIVNEFNVRGFLNDIRNEQIINDFFAFLTGSTSMQQFKEIYYSDKKLSSVFNQYYNQAIFSGVQATTAIINDNLANTSAITSYNYYHDWNNGSSPFKMSGMTQDIIGGSLISNPTIEMDTFTTDESYYLPVFISRKTEQLSRNIFDVCTTSINQTLYNQFTNYTGITTLPSSVFVPLTPFNFNSLSSIFANNNISTNTTFINGATLTNYGLISFEGGSISYYSATAIFSNFTNSGTSSARVESLTDCFVNLNLETNENVDWIFNPIPVSFTDSTYFSKEGNNVLVTVGLHYVSEKGFESIDVVLTPTPDVDNSDFTSIPTIPATLSWSAGEQYKTIAIHLNSDFVVEPTEQLELTFTNYVNTIPGAITTSQIIYSDTTVLSQVSLSGLSLQQNVPVTLTAPNGNNFIVIANDFVQIQEGDSYDVNIFLDRPAIGIETVDLVINNGFVNSATTGLDFTTSPIIPATTNKITLSFAPGQTQITYTFNTNTNNIPNPNKFINLSLQNNQFCDIIFSNSSLLIEILDTTPLPRFVSINFPQFFVSFGYNGYISSELRYNPGDTTWAELNMALKFGSSVQGSHINNTPTSNRTPVSYLYDLYFWKNPGDLILYVKNSTSNTFLYQNSIIIPGQVLTYDVANLITASGLTITLPTNTNLNSITNEYQDAQWDFSFYVRYAENFYTLRDANNTLATNQVFNLGTFTIANGFTSQSVSLQPNNIWFLATDYSGLTTGRNNENYTNSTCPIYTLNGYDWSPNSSIQQNARIKGIYFIDNVSSTQYKGFNFMQNLISFTATCGSYSHTSPYTSPSSWISIPFSGI